MLLLRRLPAHAPGDGGAIFPVQGLPFGRGARKLSGRLLLVRIYQPGDESAKVARQEQGYQTCLCIASAVRSQDTMGVRAL